MQDIFSLFDLWLLIINIVILIILAILFWVKAFRKSEIESQKWFSFCLGFFMLCFSLTRLFFFFSDLYKEEIWIEMTYGFITLNFNFFWKLAALFGIGGLIFILFVLERYSVKITKYILTIIVTIGLILAIFFPVSPDLGFDARLMTYITVPLGVLGILSLYLYLMIKTPGEVRRKSLTAFIGILILFMGFMIDTALGQSLFGFDPGIIATILMIGGSIIFSIANLK
ncbi:MAG: hypothetical protein GF329_21870 [Candidatus Lokiarchaeota archaeon]|nr:hypothetical protein [Candidatus Lokiarchaeota archaeon]